MLVTAPAHAAASPRRASVRVILTDFMYPAEPASVLRPFSAGCTELIVLHVLGPWENDPRPEGPAVLHALEEGRQLDIHLDRKSIDAYLKRLNALSASVEEEVFKCGGLYVRMVADRDLEDVLRSDLLPVGLVEV
jgi:hypothetical protein